MLQEDKPMPALWNYVKTVHSTMEKEAKPEDLSGDGLTVEAGLVYTGHLTSLFQNLGIPNPYYTSVMRALRHMGCVLQLQRGGGSALSRWLIVAPPTEDSFLSVDLASKTGRAHKGKTAMAEQQIRDLVARVNRLEEFIQNQTL